MVDSEFGAVPEAWMPGAALHFDKTGRTGPFHGGTGGQVLTIEKGENGANGIRTHDLLHAMRDTSDNRRAGHFQILRRHILWQL